MSENYKKIISYNRKAKFEYEIIENFEAGIVLKGSEVKAIRAGKVSINEAYGATKNNDIYLYNANINEYKYASNFNHEPKRPRKLLLHKKQIRKLFGALKEKGQSLVPLSLYINSKNLVKIEIALAKGKKIHDKRETIKQREWEREKQRIMKNK
jgi:SsrA-binding protein